MFILITSKGEQLGFSAERIARFLERHEREARDKTITLPPSEYTRTDDPSGWSGGGAAQPAT